ncbi:MAG: CoA-binding protein [Candidatus Helarchaeota archaeon]|nr:CoA-binding protein [Candidatus Helarchaeota archaeon]
MVNLDRLFFPEHVCLIGASEAALRGVTPYLFALKKVNFNKPIYCVNRKKKKVMYGLDAYPSILDVPGDIDYAIIGVPAEEVPQLIKECSQKKVKYVTIFTAGFSELGTEKGEKLEAELMKNVTNNLRIIGPNCLGPYCQESRLVNTEIFEIKEREGHVGYICQSGGHTSAFYFIGENRGFPFNKVVSIGNQCDLTIQDFIEYFTTDPKIEVISCYIEQVKKSTQFLGILEESSKKKPIIFWKGGHTIEGELAAASHTGAMSSSYEIFQSAIKQHGGIITESMEEMADLTLGALYLAPKKLGKNVGLVVAGGGASVELTDEVAKLGLNVPELSLDTREKIRELIPEVNTYDRNPVDLGMYGWFVSVFSKLIRYIAEDPKIDILIFQFMTERAPQFAERLNDRHIEKSFLKRIKRVVKTVSIPFICILPNFNIIDPEITKIRKAFIDELTNIEVPHFPSTYRAANVISKLIEYQKFLDK